MKTTVPVEPQLLFQNTIIPATRAIDLGRLILDNNEDFVDGGCYIEHRWPHGYDQFNWLRTSLGDELVPGIQAALTELGYSRAFAAACWVSIYRPGDWIEPHMHGWDNDPYTFLTGTLCLSAPNNGKGLALGLDGAGQPWTWIADVPGQMLLFNSTLMHGTDPHVGPEPRVIVSFDIYPEGVARPAIVDSNERRFAHYSAFTSLYSLPEYELLDSKRPPCQAS